MILHFLAADHGASREYDVTKDPRTDDSGLNCAGPSRSRSPIRRHLPRVPTPRYAGRYYSVADTRWDRTAFGLLYQLFQMTVTDVSGVGVPITISK